MEQKQLDELDESYFGEEFIDEPNFEEVKVEDVKPKKTVKKKSTKSSKIVLDKVKEDKKESKKEEKKVEDKVEDKVENQVEELKEPTKDPMKKVETKPLIDPWEDEEDESGFFKEVSTWKAITGIVVILLVFSVFTQGFQFAEGNSVTGAATTITLTDAENAALSFVNNNLLQPPFVAELTSSEETAGLYKVSLSVAGQQVDSYITKDGQLFFPQGFDTSKDPLASEVEKVPEVSEVMVEDTVPVEKNPAETEVIVEVPKEEVEETVAVPKPTTEPTPVPSVPDVTLSLAAKKWLFEPGQLTVKEGQKVKLGINPVGLDFTFTIDDLGVSQEVKGSTTVEFTASKKGTFSFKCGSCEDWRGMAGNLIVE